MSGNKDMIKRVARAIAESAVWDNPEDWRDIHLSMARAAIEAMREPTEAMLDTQAMRGDPEDTKWVYQQMIEAALGDHP